LSCAELSKVGDELSKVEGLSNVAELSNVGEGLSNVGGVVEGDADEDDEGDADGGDARRTRRTRTSRAPSISLRRSSQAHAGRSRQQ
jgi:hypothetical protein